MGLSIDSVHQRLARRGHRFAAFFCVMSILSAMSQRRAPRADARQSGNDARHGGIDARPFETVRRYGRGAVGLILVACALYVPFLTARVLWLDEGFTLMRVFGGWGDLATNTVFWNGIRTTDTNPQVYFALLKAWEGLAGRTEFALKLFSAYLGLLSIAVMFALGRNLFGVRAGLLTALLAAVSPLLAWYSSELRMYPLVVCLSALGLLALRRLLRVLTGRQPRRQVVAAVTLWLLTLALSMLTHYAYIGMVVGQSVYAAIALIRAGVLTGKRIAGLVLAGLVTGVPLAIIADAPALLERFLGGAEYSFEFKPLNDVIGSMASGLLFGVNRPDPSAGWLSWVYLALWLAAVSTLIYRADTRSRGTLVAFAAVVPVLVWFVLSLVKPNFAGVRHLMLIMPAVLAALAGALTWLTHRTRFAHALTGLLLAGHVYGLAHVYIDTPERHDDWRAMTRLIREQWLPGDIVLANPGTPRELLRGYLGNLPTPVLSTVNADPAQISAAGRVWYANTGAAPERPDTLRDRPLAGRHRFAARTITLELLLLGPTQPATGLPAGAIALPADRPGLTQIAGVGIGAPNAYALAPNLPVRVYWRPGSDADQITELTVRLKSDQDTVVETRWPVAMSATVDAGMPVADVWLTLPTWLPRVSYDLELLVADRAGAQVQRTVLPLPPAAVDCCVRFAGWQPKLGPSGAVDTIDYTPGPVANQPWVWLRDTQARDVDYERMTQPGQMINIAITWHFDGRPSADIRQGAMLRTLTGQPLAEVADAPLSAALRNEDWPANAAVRGVLALQIPSTLTTGWYRLDGWRTDGSARVATFSGLVRVEDYAASPVPTEVGTPMDANAGEMVLMGYTLAQPLARGQSAKLLTHWRIDATPARDGVLFAHVVGPDGQLATQDDMSPERGTRDTRTYRPGAGYTHQSTLTLKPDAPSGEYRLYVGIYDRDDNERWPAQLNGGPARDDLILLTTFRLP
jgi:Dolichyl-phosphate-mannose-protein mannosyltransferase